jgi:hypothetical protein
MITTKGTSRSQTPSDPALTPDNVTAKLGRPEGQSPANVDLSSDPAVAKRPSNGAGARRVR